MDGVEEVCVEEGVDGSCGGGCRWIVWRRSVWRMV